MSNHRIRYHRLLLVHVNRVIFHMLLRGTIELGLPLFGFVAFRGSVLLVKVDFARVRWLLLLELLKLLALLRVIERDDDLLLALWCWQWGIVVIDTWASIMLKYGSLFLHKLFILLLLMLLLLLKLGLSIGIPLLFLENLWKVGLLHMELVCLALSATFHIGKCLLNSWYDACCCYLTILSHHCFSTRLFYGSTIVCPTLL